MRKRLQLQLDYHEEYKLHCVTCGGGFTRIYDLPPRDETEAKRRASCVENIQQCPFCSRFRPVAQEK